MMFRVLSLVAAPTALLLATLPGASAHAQVSNIRVPGPAHLKACGKTSFDEVTKDPTGHIEEQEPVTPGCELELCRGLLFNDQAATAASTVKTAPGGNITFNVKCTIPHGGPATVALVDTTTGGTGTVIGGFLKQFDSFCPTDGATPPDQSTLQVTLPDATTLAGKCSKPGDCVTQLFWTTPDHTQNYYYCKDTIISGGATQPSAPAPAKAPAPGVAQTGVPTGVTDPAAENGVADPAPTDSVGTVDQPTDVAAGNNAAVGTGVTDTATPTSTADAGTSTGGAPPATGKSDGPSFLKKLLDDLKSLLSKQKSPTTPVESPVAAKRWIKEHY